jgi:epoxyqueuosine reductase
VFGCDVCQEVCPHNHHPPDPDEDDLLPRHAWLDLDELLATDDDQLMERFLGTPLRRPRAEGLKRNAAVVLGNLGDPEGARALHDHGLSHPHEMVRDAARWALDQLPA